MVVTIVSRNVYGEFGVSNVALIGLLARSVPSFDCRND